MGQSGVIFDMDGVLVASGPAHAASWRIVAKKSGLEVAQADFLKHFGRPSRDIVRTIWGAAMSDEEVKRIDDAKEAAYRDLITGMVPLTIGLRETLSGLRSAGLRIAIGTSGPRENVELVIREARLESSFDAVVTGFDVKRGKPAPDCFLLAAERLGLTPRACVVVEDAPVGVQAAKAAGIACIGLVGTHPRATLEAERCEAIVDRLNEVTPALVEKLLMKQ